MPATLSLGNSLSLRPLFSLCSSSTKWSRKGKNKIKNKNSFKFNQWSINQKKKKKKKKKSGSHIFYDRSPESNLCKICQQYIELDLIKSSTTKENQTKISTVNVNQTPHMPIQNPNKRSPNNQIQYLNLHQLENPNNIHPLNHCEPYLHHNLALKS